ncbi:MAG: sulfatase-like hydrolase/transferase [Colwellia sp.]|nr:sulfatase-like hydrolase/transferase [Colwellia sp.]
MKLSRRSFLQISGAAAVLSGTSLTGCSSKASPPNVLFISVDDLNDWIGALKGHPQARTPNIDKLMNSGTNFTSAHCSAPVCSASRNSLLTGLKPSTTGWYTNAKFQETADELLGDTPTLPEHFKNNGYKTMAGGKVFHMGTSDYRHDKQWHETLPYYEITNQYLLDRGYGYARFGGKDHKYYPFPKDGGQIVQGLGADTPGKSLCWGALDRKDIPHNGVMPDEYIANWAVEQLSKEYQQPFFLAAGFIRPHVPFTAPKEYFDLFPLDDIIMPDIIEDEMSDIPRYGKAMALGIIPGGDHNAVTKLGPTFWKELIRANLACIAFVDAQVGKVLDALEQSRHKDNTLVILWSDHGQNFGEHKNWRKQSLWEESTHVPLVIKLPKQVQGQKCHQVVSLLDIYPTLTQLCQLPDVPSNEGLSLNTLINNPEHNRSQPAITTWGYKNHSVRDEHWRYIQYRDGSEELYNHQNDAHEHYNLAKNTKYNAIKEKLKLWLPKENKLPSHMSEWDEDFLEQRLNKWQQENGIPDWLS